MSLERVQAREERVRAEAALLERVSGMSLEELRRSSSARHGSPPSGRRRGRASPRWRGFAGSAAGRCRRTGSSAIPSSCGSCSSFREHQLALVLRGDFGAHAQARAAAPAVVEHLTELAGAQRACDGTRRGRAMRDRDAITAGQVVLDVAGVRVQGHQHEHVHQVLLEQMSDGELELLATGGAWPERFQQEHQE